MEESNGLECMMEQLNREILHAQIRQCCLAVWSILLLGMSFFTDNNLFSMTLAAISPTPIMLILIGGR